MNKLSIVFCLVVLPLLTACAGSLPGVSKQGHAGITDWTVNFDPETGHVQEARIIDGKEKADVAFKVDLKSGIAEYSARDVRAFDGQAARGRVEQILAQEYGEALPAAIEQILQVIEVGS